MLRLTMEGNLDLQAALAALDPDILPTEEQIDAVTRKRLTKGALVLTELGQNEPIQDGDTVAFAITGAKPKYNKAKLSVTVGQGLYSKEVEQSMLGRRTGDCYDAQAEGEPVRVVIQEVRRKTVPEPTDEMALAQDLPDVHTVAEFREYVSRMLWLDASINASIQAQWKLDEQVKIEEPDEETIRRVAKCDYDYLSAYHRNDIAKELGIPPEEITEDQMRKMRGYGNFEEFLANQRVYFPIKIKECVMLSAALGVELTGEYDPFANYEAGELLSERFRSLVRENLMKRRRTK